MIQLNNEKDIWNEIVSKMDANTIDKLIEIGQHWIQIKTLDRNASVVYWGEPPDVMFDIKMRGLAEFLFDLHKNIWQ